MIMDEYIIVNKIAIQKRLKELEKSQKENPFTEAIWVFSKEELQKILSQSTPLIPEIEKAFLAGRAIDNIDSINDMKPTYIQFEYYIANLKLNI